MKTREMTANASRLIVEQLVASGVKYVFNNSGSREALFFDELHSRSALMIAGNIPGRTQTMPLAIWEAVVSGEDDPPLETDELCVKYGEI